MYRNAASSVLCGKDRYGDIATQVGHDKYKLKWRRSPTGSEKSTQSCTERSGKSIFQEK
jgi:hypothetical protein